MTFARLERLAARAAALATTRRVRLASQLLLLGGLVFVLLRFRTIWRDSGFSLQHVEWGLVAAAVALGACGVAATAFIWLSILRRLGVGAERWLVGIFFQAQLSKYIPGSVWQYAGRTTLAQTRGVPVRPVALSLLVEMAAAALAGGAVSLALLGVGGAVAAACVVAAFAGATRLRSPRRFVAATVHATWLYAGVWACLGLSYWLTARALFGVPFSQVLTYAGVFSLAWLAGFAAIYAPGGIGVREAVSVALLRGRLGAADALVLAAASRAILTFVDVAAATAGTALLRMRSRAVPGVVDQGPPVAP